MQPPRHTVVGSPGTSLSRGRVIANREPLLTLDNSTQPIKDLAGNNLQPNDSSGVTQFLIQLSSTPPSTWQNPNNRLDVNNDGIVSAADAIIIINRLIKPTYPTDFPGGVIPAGTPAPPYIDVDGDKKLFPVDAIQVINYLLTHPPGTSSLVATPTAAPATANGDAAAAAPAAIATSESADETLDAASDQAIVAALAAGAVPSASTLGVGPYSVVDVQAAEAAPRAGSQAAFATADDAFASDDDWNGTTLDDVLADLADETDRETAYV